MFRAEVCNESSFSSTENCSVLQKYDAEHDILHVFLPGPPGGYYAEELCPGVYVERLEQDDRIIGAIVFDYSTWNKEELVSLLPFLENCFIRRYSDACDKL